MRIVKMQANGLFNHNNNEQFLYSANLNINELNAHVTQHSQTYTHEQKMTKRHMYMHPTNYLGRPVGKNTFSTQP